MATQEIVEHLELDPEAEEAADDDLWLVRQIARVLNLYALGWLICLIGVPVQLKLVTAVSRLPRRKTSPAEQLRSLLLELQSVMSQEMRSTTGTAGRMVLASVHQLVHEITHWVNTDVRLETDERKLIVVCMVILSARCLPSDAVPRIPSFHSPHQRSSCARIARVVCLPNVPSRHNTLAWWFLR